MELRELLVEYKEVSLKLIKAIKVDNEPEVFMNKREELLNRIKRLEFSKEDIAALVNEFNMLQIENEIKMEFSKVRNDIKSQLIDLKNKKAAARGYGAQINNINLLNKHI